MGSITEHHDKKQLDSRKNYAERLKWLLVFLLLVVAVVGNYKFKDINLPVRAISVIAVVAVAVFIALLKTVKGKAAVIFAKEARIELKKVVWLSRQEVTQTTLIVVAVTAVISLLLWGMDGIIVRLISLITSY